jgi:hypothetical protein
MVTRIDNRKLKNLSVVSGFSDIKMKKTINKITNGDKGYLLEISIWDVPPEISIPEIKSAGVKNIYSLYAGSIRGNIEFETFDLALEKANELISNGWDWPERPKTCSC